MGDPNSERRPGPDVLRVPARCAATLTEGSDVVGARYTNGRGVKASFGGNKFLF